MVVKDKKRIHSRPESKRTRNSATAYTTGAHANKGVPPTNLHTVGSEEMLVSSDKAKKTFNPKLIYFGIESKK